ncbi:hypothetical protein IFM89_005397 [Coptis chinensis]|uniref:DYW domain-containing protein n=1 Tax=Coptis chinensis TaxID=261450 RepID=A0A835MBS5_9MAGN|nr:hypothetical protein IFM89_005397 [Coptis chinensis]
MHAILRVMSVQMKEAGYAPHTNFPKFILEDEEQYILAQIVKVGLVSLLRSCQIKLTGREIALTTARFHHFKDGLCSCKEIW